jgi:phosphoribosylanthranilate isomerase
MRPRVKICGVRRLEDAALAADLGASAVGFIFWPASPRFIDPYRAKGIVRALPPFLATIGVFVDQPPEHVSAVARLLNLSAIQLHGHEDTGPFTRTGYRVIKSVPVAEGFRTEVAAALPPEVTVLLDAHDPVRRGGTGTTIDWTAAARVAALRRTILSGGLNAGNVRSAVDEVRPYGVDVSSGVESAPGVKDPDKLRALFAALEGLRTS